MIKKPICPVLISDQQTAVLVSWIVLVVCVVSLYKIVKYYGK